MKRWIFIYFGTIRHESETQELSAKDDDMKSKKEKPFNNFAFKSITNP